LTWINRVAFLSDPPASLRSTKSILGRTQLLAMLTPEWLDRLAGEARVLSFSKGQTIFQQSEPCPGLYCVGQGRVRLFKLGPNGKELVLHFAEPGGTFAEVAAIAGFSVPANAEAVEDTVCALLPAERLRQLLKEHHALCLGLLTGMSYWVQHLVGMLEDIVLRDAAGRVARHLLEADSSQGREAFQLKLLKKDLASQLNITSETLSRTLRRLADAGLIELGEGQRLRVLEPEGLQSLVRGSGEDRFG
jgi:CRP/FNR family transcriptional regulator